MADPQPHLLVRCADLLVGALAQVNRPIARAGRFAAGALIACMLALAIAQIVSRAAFHHTLDWAEELARFTLVWAVLMVAPFAYRSGAKVAIAALVQSLPPRLLVATSIVLNLLAGWICAMLLAESAAFWQRGLSLTASALPIQMAWVYAIVPTALLALLLVAAELVLRLVASVFRPDPQLRLVGSVASVDDD
jgi:TRAP-type C4-dicarboxylate transport system permease small subunit